MKVINKRTLPIKIQFFICLVLSTNFGIANTSAEVISNSKLSETTLNDSNEKIKQDKNANSIKNSSNNNFHEIMSTKGDCSSNCCTGDNSMRKIKDSKEKLNSQKIKKKFGWFSRSK